MLLDLRTLGIKPDVRRLFVYDNRMFAEREIGRASCRERVSSPV